MRVIKDIALQEPLVDTVDARSIISTSVPILNLDVLTCKKEDLAFTTEFTLQFKRNDYCHAFVAYFECAFTQVSVTYSQLYQLKR
jgi:type I protein arginine methyltransferase